MYDNELLRRDPETIVIGETTESERQLLTEAVQSGEPTISVIYANLACYRKSILDASGLRLEQPAMYEVCLSIIDKDPNALLPRGLNRRIARAAKRARGIYEQPIERIIQ